MKYALGWGLVTLLGVAVGGFGYITFREMTAPPLLSFESVATPPSPAVPEQPYNVSAQTVRRNSSGCTNGPQADLRDGMGNVIRLPVPARTMSEAISTYALIVPKGVKPGRYGLKLRESFNCSGRPHIIEAPWVYIQVGDGSATS